MTPLFMGNLTHSLVNFISGDRRNEWIHVDPLNMYIRRSVRVIDGKPVASIDIANVFVKPSMQGKGYFTKTLEIAIEVCKGTDIKVLYIENVLNASLAAHLIGLGWGEQSIAGIPSFYREV